MPAKAGLYISVSIEVNMHDWILVGNVSQKNWINFRINKQAG